MKIFSIQLLEGVTVQNENFHKLFSLFNFTLDIPLHRHLRTLSDTELKTRKSSSILEDPDLR